MDGLSGWICGVLALAFAAYIGVDTWRMRRERERSQAAMRREQDSVRQLITERDGFARQVFELQKALDQTAQEHREAASALLVARDERDRLYWLRWWMRNAIEAPHVDPARSFYLRWAIAAHFATDLEALHRDLLRLAHDANRPESERIHARAFASELESTKRTPWETWRATGKPEHNPSAVQAAYFAALDSWAALLGPQGS